MSNVVFVVDTGSDFEKENEFNLHHPVDLVPLNIHFGDDLYLDSVELSKEQFYQKMDEAEELPKTSQPSPQTFHDVFKKHLDEGKEVISISISSEMSGTFQSTTIAKDMLEEDEQQKVHLVDSENVSAAVLLLLKKADELLQEGKSVEETVEWLNQNKGKVKVYALLDTLENLKKGGRISHAQAFIGGLLNIKPLVTIAQGKVDPLGKARGRKKGLKQLSEVIGSLDQYDQENGYVIHSFPSENDIEEELKKVIKINDFKHSFIIKLGSTIGTHAGVHVLGVALLEK